MQQRQPAARVHGASRTHVPEWRPDLYVGGAAMTVNPPAAPAQRGFLKPEVIGPEDCPILYRWTFGGRLASKFPVKLMLHHFPPRADDRDVHDHPRPFITLVLRGGYDDYVPCSVCRGRRFVPLPHIPWERARLSGEFRACRLCCSDIDDTGFVPTGIVCGERMRAGMIRRRRAGHTHRTRVGDNGCWTLVLQGPKRREWGFLRNGEWWPWRKYRDTFGAGMRCD